MATKSMSFSLEEYIFGRMTETLIDFSEIEKLVVERTTLASSYAVDKALNSLVMKGKVKLLKKKYRPYGFKRFYQRA